MPPPDGIICKFCSGKFLKSGYAFHEKKCEDLFRLQNIKCTSCDNFINKDNYKMHEPECKKRMKKINELKAAKVAELRKNAPPPPVQQQQSIITREPTDTCEECTDLKPAHICDECDQYLCISCDTKLHSKGSRIKHIRRAIGAAAPPSSQSSGPISVIGSNSFDNFAPKGLAVSYDSVADTDVVEDERVPCNFCGRKFGMARVAIHENVCALPKKNRKTWDYEKKRIEGTVMEEFVGHRTPTPESIIKERKEGHKWRAERERLRGIIEDGNKWVADRKAVLREEIEKQLEAQEAQKKETANLPSYMRGKAKPTGNAVMDAKLEVQQLAMGNSKADAFAMNWSDAEINLRQEVLADILAKRQTKINGGSVAATTESLSKPASVSKTEKTIESKINAPTRPISKYEASKNEVAKPISSGLNKPAGLVKPISSSSQAKLVSLPPSKPSSAKPVDKPPAPVTQLVSPPPRSVSVAPPKRVIPPPPPHINKSVAPSPAKNVPTVNKPVSSNDAPIINPTPSKAASVLPPPPTSFVEPQGKSSLEDYRQRELERRMQPKKSVLPPPHDPIISIPKPVVVAESAPKKLPPSSEPKEPLVMGGGRLGGNTKDSYSYSQDKDGLRDARANFFNKIAKK